MRSARSRGGIFISYRREDTAAYAGRLYDRLSDRFDEDRVFMDVDSIAIGVDFTRAIRDAVSGCDILLVLIGRDWSAVTDDQGRRRIDASDDFVRVEIETALQRDIRVVPVLVDGAVLPQVGDLPSSLRPLVRRQALTLSHAGFRSEVARLVVAIDEVLEATPGRFADPRTQGGAPSSERRPGHEPMGQRASAATPPGPQPFQHSTAAAAVPQTLAATLNHGSRWNPAVLSVAFSPDGRLLASGGANGTIGLWDPIAGKRLRTITAQTNPLLKSIHSVAFSPDGRLLASASNNKTVWLWDPATGAQLNILTGHTGWVSSVAFSPDGGLLASGSNDKTVWLWDPATGAQLNNLTGHTGRVSSVAFSPDGGLLASASHDMTVRLWDPATGAQLNNLTGHTGWVSAVAFSPDGGLLASASWDKTVRLWDPATGAQLNNLTGHTDRVSSVAFSPDGRLLASGSNDKTVRLWDPATRQQLRALTVPPRNNSIYSVALSPDGRLLASGCHADLKLWR